MISLLVFVVIMGLVLHLINTALPGPQWFKTVVNVVACLIVIIWLLQWIGYVGGGPYLHVRW